MFHHEGETDKSCQTATSGVLYKLHYQQYMYKYFSITIAIFRITNFQNRIGASICQLQELTLADIFFLSLSSHLR